MNRTQTQVIALSPTRRRWVRARSTHQLVAAFRAGWVARGEHDVARQAQDRLWLAQPEPAPTADTAA